MAVAALLRRDRAMLVVAIVAVTGLAWSYLAWLAMAGMDMGGAMDAALEPAFRAWTAGEFVFMFFMWAVMMIGMMTPSVAPMLLLYAAVGRKAGASGRPLAATGWFAAGYLAAWIGFSVAATGAQYLLTRLALLTPMMASASGLFGGIVLICAGLYQWSFLKEACLRQCQTPLGFLLSRGGFRSDPLAALRLGAAHGAYCVGCCWVLMTLLFVGGVMNLVWIAGLTILVLLEKAVPTGRLVPRIVGAVMATAGILLLAKSF